MSNYFEDKIVALSGGTSGIGLETARQLIGEGAIVYILGRQSSRLDAAIESLGERAYKKVVDFSDHADIEAAIDDIVSTHGALDILIANAGAYIDGDILENDPAQWDGMLNININATMKSVRAALRPMKAQGRGDIIVTGSIAGVEDVTVSPVYTASKQAIQGFVHTTRRQVAASGIRIGSVLPGPVETPLLDDWDQERLRQVRDSSGVLAPGDITDAILFMLTRPAHVVIRDLVIIPSRTDRF